MVQPFTSAYLYGWKHSSIDVTDADVISLSFTCRICYFLNTTLPSFKLKKWTSLVQPFTSAYLYGWKHSSIDVTDADVIGLSFTCRICYVLNTTLPSFKLNKWTSLVQPFTSAYLYGWKHSSIDVTDADVIGLSFTCRICYVLNTTLPSFKLNKWTSLVQPFTSAYLYGWKHSSIDVTDADVIGLSFTCRICYFLNTTLPSFKLKKWTSLVQPFTSAYLYGWKHSSIDVTDADVIGLSFTCRICYVLNTTLPSFKLNKWTSLVQPFTSAYLYGWKHSSIDVTDADLISLSFTCRICYFLNTTLPSFKLKKWTSLVQPFTSAYLYGWKHSSIDVTDADVIGLSFTCRICYVLNTTLPSFKLNKWTSLVQPFTSAYLYGWKHSSIDVTDVDVIGLSFTCRICYVLNTTLPSFKLNKWTSLVQPFTSAYLYGWKHSSIDVTDADLIGLSFTCRICYL